MAVEPLRRRLTLGSVQPGSGPDAGEDEIGGLKALLGPLAEKAKESGTKFAVLWTVKLRDGEVLPEKADKRMCCVSSFESTEQAQAWAESQGVGYRCVKGKKPDPDSQNQDNFAFILAEGEYNLYLVLDGHGPKGHHVSGFVLENLLGCLLGNPSRTVETFRDTFLHTQKLVEEAPGLDAEMSGTTVTLAYHDLRTDILTLAHVGDSRAILGPAATGTLITQTQDHKPDLPEERRRIENADPPGRVVFDGYFNHRVFTREGKKPGPGLNMSRAIGDVMGHHEAGLSAEPDVREVDLKPFRASSNNLQLLLCSDGVWEFIENEDAMRIICDETNSKSASAGITALVDSGYSRWLTDSGGEIADDVTGILVHLFSQQVPA